MAPSVRSPAVAGTFYPAEPGRLAADVRGYLAAAEPLVLGFPLRILVVPHAGHMYSGPVAATGYRLLEGIDALQRIVMIGPSHFAPFSGLALPGVEYLETPLGMVAVDVECADVAGTNALVIDSAAAHRQEHSLEVQLPFLQIVAPGVPIVPLLTGAVEPDEAADAVAALIDDSTLLLISSDLSHFYDAATARRLDATTAESIRRLDPAALDREAACGRTGIQIALHLARRYGYEADVLDLRNSADTAGHPQRVVGYGTFAFGVR